MNENEENSFSIDSNRSIMIKKNYKLECELSSDLALQSYTTIMNKNIENNDEFISNLILTNNKNNEIKAPKIIKDLSPVYKSSEPFSLRLIVQGDNLSIEWYHADKKVVPLVNQIQFIQLDSYHTYELVFNFSHPFTSDSGYYYCKISNQCGIVLSSTTLVRITDADEDIEQIDESIFQSKPIFIEYFFDVCVEKENEAVFKCKIVGKPNPIVQWFFGHQMIKNDNKYELQKDDLTNHHILIVKNITTEDQGEYTCNAKNGKGDASWSANLYFNKTLISKSTELSLKANSYLEKLNEKELNLDNFMSDEYYSKMKQFENNSIKDLIKNLTDCHEKINNLETNLNDGLVHRNSQFEEIDSDHYDESTSELVRNMPKIIQDLKSEQSFYKTTEPFSITLVAQGDSLIVEWFHDDEKVIPLIHQIEFIKMDSPKTYELVFNFNNPLVTDSGVYYCSISNRFGSILSSKVSIKIMDPDNEYVIEERIIKNEEERTKSKRRVRFSLPRDSDVFLIPFHKTQIPTAPGNPKILDFKQTSLLLSWTPSQSDLNFYDKEDRDIDSQSNLSYLIEYTTSESNVWAVFASNINQLSTYVDNLNNGVVYSFRIRAENQIGISDVSPTVSTKGLYVDDYRRSSPETNHIVHSRFRREFISFDLNQPQISNEQKDVHYFVDGQTAEVSMLVFGYPLPSIKWMRNKKMLVSDGKKYKMHSDRFSYYHLEVLNATSTDEGLYQLVATNENGKCCIHDIYLQQADPPMFIETFIDTKAKNYQDVFLTCRVEGIPAPEIKFYKDKFRLVESTRLKIKHIKPETWIIHIENAFASDSGLYSCAIKNMAGESVCSCKLTVEQELIMPYTETKTVYSYNRARATSVDYQEKEKEEKMQLAKNSEIYNPDIFEEEDLDLAEGAFLLPVIDTSLLIRIREYRRELPSNLASYGGSNSKLAIKERIEVNSSGNFVRSSSLSRDSVDREDNRKNGIKQSESFDKDLNKQVKSSSVSRSSSLETIEEATKPEKQMQTKIEPSNQFSGLYIRLSENTPVIPFVSNIQNKEQHQKLPGKLNLIEFEASLISEKKEQIKLGKKEKGITISNYSPDSPEKIAKAAQSWGYYNLNFDKSERLAPIIREKLKDAFLIESATITLECKIEGNPTPRYFWYHNNRIIHGNDGRTQITQSEDGNLKLTITNAKKSDLGNYRCTAMNRFGITVATAKITPAQLPDRPSKPIVYQHSDVSALITWQAPPYNNNSGNANILGFKIDYKMADEFRWSNALYTTDDRCLVTNLQPLTKYRFRISCINSFGFSQYSWASEECETLAYGYSNITIETELFERLMNNRYDLLKSGDQWMLVKKSFELPKPAKENKSDPVKELVKPVISKTLVTKQINKPVMLVKTVEEVMQKVKIKPAVSAKAESWKKIKEAIDNLTQSKNNPDASCTVVETETDEQSKGNAFDKFKTAYLSGSQNKKELPKSKYLQLY